MYGDISLNNEVLTGGLSGVALLSAGSKNALSPGDVSAELDADFSPLQSKRLTASPTLPAVFVGGAVVVSKTSESLGLDSRYSAVLEQVFPSLCNDITLVEVQPHPDINAWADHPPLRIGIVLSGGQAPGGHNVIAGVYDYIKRCNPNSQLFGFLMGPFGIYEHRYVEISDAVMNRYRNQGGFDMIRSGRHKVDTAEQKAMSLQVVKKLDLHGLVVVGGDDSNTNAAILAEYFAVNADS